MDIDGLRAAYAESGLNQELYDLIIRTVEQIIVRRRYPPTYSPYGRWDQDTYDDLAHEWTLQRLLRSGQLEHLLLNNETLSGFQHGLELSFIGFLLNQRQRTALENLYDRTAAILERDPRFQRVGDTTRKSEHLWGLAEWRGVDAFAGDDAGLIGAGLEVECPPVIRYRPNARKHSPIISEPDLAEYLHALYTLLHATLRLSQLTTIFRYRFNLLESAPLRLDDARFTSEGEEFPQVELVDQGEQVEAQVLITEAVDSVLLDLTARQRQALHAYAHPNATLTVVAQQLGCSKSTVENEVRRAVTVIGQYADGAEEASQVYSRLLERLVDELEN